MNEDALFSAYRNHEGTYVTDCACGETIACSVGTEWAISEALSLHQGSAVHQQWREWQEAVHALQRPARRPCPCHMHAAS